MSKTYISKGLRRRVSEKARYRCGYCLAQEEIVGIPMDVDHIIPESLGGPTTEENLWLACSLCNDHKGNQTAALDEVSKEVVPIFNPRSQRWDEHFAWTSEGDCLLGLTAIGRATIAALNLNLDIRVRARRRWVMADWHPPKD